MNVLFVGNCQTDVASQIFSVISISSHARWINGRDLVDEKLPNDEFLALIPKYDAVVHSNHKILTKKLESLVGENVPLISFPTIAFEGEMQDCVYIGEENEVKSPVGSYHSFIIFCAFYFNISEEYCIRLFNQHFYKKLGYIDVIEPTRTRLQVLLAVHGVDSHLVDKWISSDQFMHTINHPKLFVIEDVLKQLLVANKIPFRDVNVSGFMKDPLAEGASFPRLIETLSNKALLAEKLYFKKGGTSEPPQFVSLQDFISASYKVYSKLDKNKLTTARFGNGQLEVYRSLFEAEVVRLSSIKSNKHAYSDLPDYCFWKRAVSRVAVEDFDPVISSEFKIKKHHKIATAGSCFAQHIAKSLSKSGYNYFVPETAPDGLSEQEALEHGYGVFSCRYGNLYTTRQLLQLFDRAFDNFSSDVPTWERRDGKLIDPFRPQIQAVGFNSEDELLASRDEHLSAVRKMFCDLDVFVFTLGLTECWEYVADGTILPTAPGVVGGSMDWDKYKFRNFSKNEVQSDLEQFIEKLKKINPEAVIILTVSPVSLMATYERRHVLVSTTVSKSILRVVADEVASTFEHVHYFPSYEIITGNYNKGAYFEDDLREVKRQGVEHVMGLFTRYYTGDMPIAANGHVEQDINPPVSGEASNILKASEDVNEIFCDEEALDNDE